MICYKIMWPTFLLREPSNQEHPIISHDQSSQEDGSVVVKQRASDALQDCQSIAGVHRGIIQNQVNTMILILGTILYISKCVMDNLMNGGKDLQPCQAKKCFIIVYPECTKHLSAVTARTLVILQQHQQLRSRLCQRPRTCSQLKLIPQQLQPWLLTSPRQPWGWNSTWMMSNKTSLVWNTTS